LAGFRRLRPQYIKPVGVSLETYFDAIEIIMFFTWGYLLEEFCRVPWPSPNAYL
jgi:hypothetical protein